MKEPALALRLSAKQSREWEGRQAWNQNPVEEAGFGCYYHGNEVDSWKELPGRKSV
jgi:hypothetical protein